MNFFIVFTIEIYICSTSLSHMVVFVPCGFHSVALVTAYQQVSASFLDNFTTNIARLTHFLTVGHVALSYRGLPGPQPGHHDWRSPPPDRFWQHDGEPVLPVDLLQAAHQNHDLRLAQIRSGQEILLSGWMEKGRWMNVWSNGLLLDEYLCTVERMVKILDILVRVCSTFRQVLQWELMSWWCQCLELTSVSLFIWRNLINMLTSAIQ